MRPGRRGRATAAAAAVLLLLASLAACAGRGDPGSTTDIVLLGPTPSGELLDALASAYAEGHPGVHLHTVFAPTSGLAESVRSQSAGIDVLVSDDPAVLDALGSRVAGRRTLGRDASGHRLVAATLSDSQHSDLGGDVVRWLSTSPAKQLLAARGWH